jgi:hypothetical protein
MDKNERITPAMIMGGLLFHRALLATLYVDHIENDKERRGIRETVEKSLEIFQKDVRFYIKNYPLDLSHDEIRQAATDNIEGFFQDVQRILKSRPGDKEP